MLDDPKARPAVVHFHSQWLGTDRVLRIAPARRAFGPLFGIEPELETARDDDVQWPTIMGPVRHSMKLETELFVEQTVFDGDGTFTALMTDHHGFLSDATAPDLRRRSHPPFRPARGDAGRSSSWRCPSGARNRSPSTPPRSLETSAPGC